MKRLALALFVATIATSAVAQSYGDWSVGELPQSDGGYYAATSNASGGLLGKSCTLEGCKWVLNTKATCDEGSRYPALLNAKQGAEHVTLVCAPNATVPGRYVVLDYEAIEHSVKTGEMIGVAMPMENGDFRVSRFSLKGLALATQQLMRRAAQLGKQPGDRVL